MSSQQLRVFLVISVLIASNETKNLIRNSVETLRSMGKLPVFLRFSGDSSIQLYPWVSEMPISCLVATRKCFEADRPERRCDPIYLRLFQRYHLKNIVFLEPSQPRKDTRELSGFITWYLNVPVLVVLSPGEDVPRIRESCSTMWISNTMIDLPHENCVRGGGRKRTRRISGDTFRAQDESRYPKNVVLVISEYGYQDEDKNAYTRYREAVAYLKALPVLNVTPVFTEMGGHEDVIIQPYILLDTDVFLTRDTGGVYTCTSIGFFSSKVSPNPLSVISFSSLSALLSALIVIGAVITVSLCFTRSLFPYQSCRISGLILFLVASSLGRSPVPLHSPSIPFRVLLVLWLFGTFMIGAYVQSQITSEYNSPAYSPAVETTDDLERMISSGKILPCVDVGIADALLMHKESYTGILRTVTRVIERSFESCIVSNDECYSRARENTHVYIAPVDFAKKRAALEWGLSPGKDVLLSYCSVAPARKDYRYTLQHRRLVLALAESGLTISEERSRTWNDTREASRTVTFSFTTQFLVLICGYAGSCLIFLCELMFNQLMVLKDARS